MGSKANRRHKRMRHDVLRWLYNHRCFWCGGAFAAGDAGPRTFSIDELVPRSRDGRRTLENQVPAHRLCNNRRGNGMPRDDAILRHYGMLLDHRLLPPGEPMKAAKR